MRSGLVSVQSKPFRMTNNNMGVTREGEITNNMTAVAFTVTWEMFKLNFTTIRIN